MSSITQAQWDAIGRKAAAVARDVANRIVQEQLSLPLPTPKNLNIVVYGANSASGKSQDMLESLVGKICAAEAGSNINIEFRDDYEVQGVHIPIKINWADPEPDEPREGDRWLQNGEIFTYFMGEWRRRSALESFAAAKKYL